MRIQTKIVIFILIILGFLARIYKINTPLADWHSWRQVDTASVAHVFVNEGFDLLHPRYHDLSNIASGKENPQGFRFVEFPFYNALMGFLYKTFPIFPLHVWGRIISIIFSLASGILLYLLVKKYWNETVAVLSLVFFYFLPFNIFYSRVVLPEPIAVFFAILAVFLFLNKKSFLLSFLAASISILIKPTAIFILLGAWTWGKKEETKRFFMWLIFSSLPFLAWRLWMRQFPEGISAVEWLLSKVNTSQGLVGIAFTPAFFRWIFIERLGKLILGVWGTVFLALGLSKKKALDGPFYQFLFGALLYLFIFSGGNIQHDYYQIMIIPAITPFIALGVTYFFERKKEILSSLINIVIGLFCLIFAFFASAYQIKDFYKYNPDLVKAGEEADQLLPKDALVVADYNGDTTFLYQTKRKGYPSLFLPLEELQKKGAQFYLTVKPKDPFIEELAPKYTLFYRDEFLAIVQLK